MDGNSSSRENGGDDDRGKRHGEPPSGRRDSAGLTCGTDSIAIFTSGRSKWVEQYITTNGLCVRDDLGRVVTAQAGTVIPGNNRRKIRAVWKELCYGKAETLEDAKEAASWWQYNLVR